MNIFLAVYISVAIMLFLRTDQRVKPATALMSAIIWPISLIWIILVQGGR